MYPPVPSDEIAFAMTLFVGAANGQSLPSGKLQPVTEARECEELFLALSFGTGVMPDPMRRAALLESSLFRAFCSLWQEYASDRSRRSICARVLGFCFLMERSRGKILQFRPAAPSPGKPDHDLVTLHPAVVEALSCVRLEPNGMLTESAFLEQLARTAEHYLDLEVRSGAATGWGDEPESNGVTWPAGESETAELMRRKDWTHHLCGPVSSWPQSKKTAIELVLACNFPMIVLWGPDLLQFYNDGYRDLMGSKHPEGLGQPTRECWPEVWSINEPVYAKALGGESITFEDQLFPIVRYGYLEDAYFTLCYSPLRDEDAAIQGVLVTVFETTLRARAHLHRKRQEHEHGTNGDAKAAALPLR
jgi:hypothetical protein